MLQNQDTSPPNWIVIVGFEFFFKGGEESENPGLTKPVMEVERCK